MTVSRRIEKNSTGGTAGRRPAGVHVLGQRCAPWLDPLTGFYRDGCCKRATTTRHKPSACRDRRILEFSKQRGNDSHANARAESRASSRATGVPVRGRGKRRTPDGARWCWRRLWETLRGALAELKRHALDLS